MKLFAASLRKRALRKYVRDLPEKLLAGYGASEYYSPAQIKAATSKLRIDPALIVYGYAAFLTQAAFEELSPPMPPTPAYDDARAAFLDLVPPAPVAPASFYESATGFGGWRSR